MVGPIRITKNVSISAEGTLEIVKKTGKLERFHIDIYSGGKRTTLEDIYIQHKKGETVNCQEVAKSVADVVKDLIQELKQHEEFRGKISDHLEKIQVGKKDISIEREGEAGRKILEVKTNTTLLNPAIRFN